MGSRKTYKPGTVFPKAPNLKYIRKADDYISPKYKHRIQQGVFVCLLEQCGNEKITKIDNVQSGATSTCGASKHNKELYTTKKRTIYQKGHIFDNSRNLVLNECGEDYTEPKSKIKHQQAKFDCILDGCTNTTKAIRIDHVKTGAIKSCGDPKHKRVLQSYIYEFIKIHYPDAVGEFKLPNSRLKCDILVPSIKTFVEVDGYQHFQMTWYDNGDPSKLERRKSCDKEKNKIIKSMGNFIYRIKEKDYCKNPTVATSKLLDFLNKKSH